MKRSVLQNSSTFFCPLNVSKCDSYLLCCEKMPCRLGGDWCCKAETADLSLLLHRIPQTGHKWKYQHALSYRYQILPGTSGQQGWKWDCRDTVPFCQPQTCTYHEVFSADRTAQIQGLFIGSGQRMLQIPPLSLGKAFLANLVFGKTLSGKLNVLKTGKWCY